MFLDPFVDYLDATTHLGRWVGQRHGVIIDNFIFFLHYRVSVALFFGASLLVTTGLYVVDPIECISDASWILHVLDTYCWVHSTFTIPQHWNTSYSQEKELSAHPGVKPQNGNPAVLQSYYQWVCYVLAFQALLFYIPRCLWKNLEGGKVNTLLKLVAKFDDKSESDLIKYFCTGRRQDNNNSSFYNSYFLKLFSCEVLNLMVDLGQLYLATFANFTFLDAIQYITMNDPLEREDYIAQIFPKVTKCTFHAIGPSGNDVAYDAICILAFNAVNEKIYLGMQLWLVILLSISSILVIYRFLLLIPAFRIMILKHSTKYTEIESFYVFRHKLSIGNYCILMNLGRNLDLLQFTDVVNLLQIQLSKVDQVVQKSTLHL
ncbi:innexin inx2 isoform X1 [Folsomia candida]|uniref:innexin inx2 isoform X1 n=1 Tax=Folsomia candida TaxID=158441 RepID=UPI000B8F0EB4|nr:innexin inx2 isoform X1 [Folsomia candida]